MDSVDAQHKAGRQRSLLLDTIYERFSDKILFVGLIDDKASLLDYRRVKRIYNIPIERQESLNVQIALVTALTKNWNDVFGRRNHVSYSSDDCDAVFLEALGSTLIITTVSGKGPQIAKKVVDMIAEMSKESL